MFDVFCVPLDDVTITRFSFRELQLRNEMRKEEIMEAVIKSEHSYAEILAFIKGDVSEE